MIAGLGIIALIRVKGRKPRSRSAKATLERVDMGEGS
jgi:hypothetical protein